MQDPRPVFSTIIGVSVQLREGAKRFASTQKREGRKLPSQLGEKMAIKQRRRDTSG